MYRFSIDGKDWILRFISKVPLDCREKYFILEKLFQIGKDLSLYSHGEAFMIVDKRIGAVVLRVEKIPSHILTVNYVIAKENWYVHID